MPKAHTPWVLGGGDSGGSTTVASSVSTNTGHFNSTITAQTTIQITDIQLTPTDTGMDLVVVTEGGPFPPSTTEVVGNALIAEISDATLALPDGESFQVFSPADGIALVEAAQIEQSVQLTITGMDAPPVADIRAEAQSLRFAIAPGDPTTVAAEDPSIRVVVTEEQGRRYTVPNATTGTRTDTPLRDIPQSIQVIPQAVFEDQGVTSLTDALRNASGVVTQSNGGLTQSFTVRGFNSAPVLRDGLQLGGGTNGNFGSPELATVEQVEVLKGPAAILFGQGNPGGVINLVGERPLSEPTYELGLRLGNRGLIEPSLDFSGPLTEDGNLLYRINALYRREDYYRDYTEDVTRVFVAPVISWAISDNTDLTVELEYREDERPPDRGLVAL
ncbi:MAG: TonB-dependent receptor plug domain-containing protein, partial [Cyanobacteria bacterium P01_H01_bin.130]